MHERMISEKTHTASLPLEQRLPVLQKINLRLVIDRRRAKHRYPLLVATSNLNLNLHEELQICSRKKCSHPFTMYLSETLKGI